MKTVPLTRGMVALVDDEDHALVAARSWRAKLRPTGVCYATSQTSRRDGRRNLYMHRLIMGAGDGALIDHIDGDGLNNQRNNLRVVTPSQNHMNRRRTAGRSRFKGVR